MQIVLLTDFAPQCKPFGDNTEAHDGLDGAEGQAEAAAQVADKQVAVPPPDQKRTGQGWLVSTIPPRWPAPSVTTCGPLILKAQLTLFPSLPITRSPQNSSW